MTTTAVTGHRRRWTLALSVLLTLGLTTPAAAAVVPAPAQALAADPAISVSKTAGVDPTGETLTVTGTGFDPAGSIGTRAPLQGQQAGVYVIFGKFLPTWRPSQSAPSTARYVIDQKWAAPGAPPVLAGNPQYVPLAADGSFTADVSAREDSRAPWDGVYGIYVYPASGASNAAQEVSQAVTFSCASGPAAPERGKLPMCDTRAGDSGGTIYRPKVELVGTALDIPSGSATVRVTGWKPSNQINVRFNDASVLPGNTANGVIATVTADANGTAQFSLPLPTLAAYRQLDTTYGDTGGHWLRLLGSDPTISLHVWLDPVRSFPDVPLQSSTFYTEITWASGNQVVNGYDDGTFRPGNQISRGAVAAMLYRAEHPGVTSKPLCTTAPFADVAVGSTFCGEIAWMKSAGITTGTNGLYEPAKTLSRQATAAFLARAWATGPLAPCTSAPFADVPVNHQFCKEIAWAKHENVSTGWADNTYRAANPVSRQAFVTFLYRNAHS